MTKEKLLAGQDHPDFNGLTMRLSPRQQGFYADPYSTYRQLHARGEAIYWEDYGHWCFHSYEAVNKLLRDRRFGRQILHVTTRQALGWAEPAPHLGDFNRIEAHSLLELEPPAHTRLRTLVNRAFLSRHVERLRPEIAQLADQLIDGFEADKSVELITGYAEIIPVTVIARMLGIPAEMGTQLLDWSHRMVRMYMLGADRAVEDDANAAAFEFGAYIGDIIGLRERAPGDDLISHMLTARSGEDKLSPDEVASTAILLLNAGHEATVHQISNAVSAILQNQLDTKIQFADAAASVLAIEELMRFDPPLHMFTRFALEDCEIMPGIKVRQGDTIGLMLGAAGHDPKKFADPGRFVADRQQGTHLAFGAGIHFCIGAPLARLELQIALPKLFARLPGIKLAEPPKWRNAFHFRGLERLDLTWD